jgi:diguanylate cyclase (GGDEF)-like protein
LTLLRPPAPSHLEAAGPPPPPVSEVHLEDFLARSHDGLQLWSPEGRLRYANQATLGMFGLPPGTEVRTYEDLLACCVDLKGSPLAPERRTLASLAETIGCEGEGLLRVRTGENRDRWLRVHTYHQYASEPPRVLTGVITTSVDVTRFVEEEQLLQRLAQHDVLTHLPNRALFDDRLRQALPRALRRKELLAVCMVDLDGFKAVNDTLGHRTGDRLLQEIAYRLGTSLRADDTAARLGGDEFALLLGGLKGPGQLAQVLGRVLQDIARPVLIDGQPVRVTASAGVALFPGDVDDPALLLRHADQAMYKAKEAGRGRYELYDPAVASKVHASHLLLRKFQEALEGGQYRLYYQPKVDCRRGVVVGLEALVRWQHPVLGLRSPGEFLPLIERDDAIIGLGEWVIGEALGQLGRWQLEGLELPVSVNVAARQFQHGSFGARLGELLVEQPAQRVKLLGIEIAETAVLEDLNAVRGLLERYRAQGISFDLDDFGTGYSSLVHLKRLPVDTLKIDQTFVRDMLEDAGDLAIVQGVINLASAFHLGVVAEGVEDIEHVLTLLELGCDVMQGYCLARPMPAARVVDWVRAFQPDPRWKLADDPFPPRSDFDLLLAAVLHRYWLQRIATLAEGGGAPAAWPELGAADCRLARWYAAAEPRRFIASSERVSFDAAHREVHRLAQRAHDEVQVGGAASAELLGALTVAGERLSQCIEALRKPTAKD